MKRDIFVSYASEDVGAADVLVAALERAGLTCWVAPRDIAVGEDYAEAIIEGIRSSRSLVTLLSDAGNRSRNVIREVERAHALDIPLLTIRLDDIEPTGSLEYFLASRQFVDAFPSVEDRADDVAIAVQAALGVGSAPATEGTGRGVRSSVAALSRTPVRLGLAAAVVVGALLAVWALTRSDGSDVTAGGPDTTTPVSTTGATVPPTSGTLVVGGIDPVVIGPTVLPGGDQSWFFVEAPDGATVTYEYDGEIYEWDGFGLGPPDLEAGQVTMAVRGEGLDFRQTVEFDVVPSSAADRACYLLTMAEMRATLAVDLLSRTIAVRGANVCDWWYRSDAEAGESAEGTVELSLHRGESALARRAWFTARGGATVLDTSLDPEVLRGEVDGVIRLMADAGHGIVEVAVPVGLADAEFRALDVLELALERSDPTVTAPSVGCELLTAREVELVVGTQVTQAPVEDPQECVFQSALPDILVISMRLSDGVDPASLETMLTEGQQVEGATWSELEGLGDRALAADAGPAYVLLAVQDGRAVQIGVGSLGQAEGSAAIARTLVEKALGFL